MLTRINALHNVTYFFGGGEEFLLHSRSKDCGGSGAYLCRFGLLLAGNRPRATKYRLACWHCQSQLMVLFSRIFLKGFWTLPNYFVAANIASMGMGEQGM